MISSAPRRGTSGVFVSSLGANSPAELSVRGRGKAVATTVKDTFQFRPHSAEGKLRMSTMLQLAFAYLMNGGNPLLNGMIHAHLDRAHAANLY
jgi:hypothetical protein